MHPSFLMALALTGGFACSSGSGRPERADSLPTQRLEVQYFDIRWFGRGSAPDVLTRRSDAPGAGSPEDRTDTYLRLPGTDELGIKLRPGGRSFEVSCASAATAIRSSRWRRPATSRRGRSGRSPVTGSAGTLDGLGLPAGSWVDVHKSRRLVTLGEGQSTCGVELTELVPGGNGGCSVGFEASGADASLPDGLTSLNEFFVDPDLVIAVGRCVSCAYPAWIRSEADDHG